MSKNAHLNAFVYFEAVVRRGSLSRAAEEMTVSPSAVSQQIKLLEQQMGLKLFRRDGRRLSPTLEGEQLFQASATALGMLRDAQRNLGKTKQSRRLNLRVTPSFGVRWLGPRLSDFVNRNPDWELRVDAAPDPTDFDREVMDMDIRYGIGQWSGFHVQPVLHDHVLPLCSPAYLESLSKDGGGENVFEKARLIESARALYKWDAWFLRFNQFSGHGKRSIVMDRSSMALQLAIDGAGIVLESLALAQAEVANGQLVPVASEIPIVTFPAYWVICPSRFLSRRAVGLFLDWLEGQVQDHAQRVQAIIDQHGLAVETVDLNAEQLRDVRSMNQ